MITETLVGKLVVHPSTGFQVTARVPSLDLCPDVERLQITAWQFLTPGTAPCAGSHTAQGKRSFCFETL